MQLRRTAFAVCWLLGGTALYAQNNPEMPSHEEKVYILVDRMPEFKGGQDSLSRYFTSNIHNPKRRRGDSRKAYVQFIIDTTGAPTYVKVIHSACAPCDAEAMRVVKAMPRWTPGMHHGQKVNVQYLIPVKFDSN